MKSLQCSILFGSDSMASEFDNALYAYINSNQGKAAKAGRRERVARFDQPRSRFRIVETDCPETLMEIKKMAQIPRV